MSAVSLRAAPRRARAGAFHRLFRGNGTSILGQPFPQRFESRKLVRRHPQRHRHRRRWGRGWPRSCTAAFLGGASFLVIADLAARLLIAPNELPVGVVTALVGGPFFLYLLRKRGPTHGFV